MINAMITIIMTKTHVIWGSCFPYLFSPLRISSQRVRGTSTSNLQSFASVSNIVNIVWVYAHRMAAYKIGLLTAICIICVVCVLEDAIDKDAVLRISASVLLARGTGIVSFSSSSSVFLPLRSCIDRMDDEESECRRRRVQGRGNREREEFGDSNFS